MHRTLKTASPCLARILDSPISSIRFPSWSAIVLAMISTIVPSPGLSARSPDTRSTGFSEQSSDSHATNSGTQNGVAIFGDGLQVLTYGNVRKLGDAADSAGSASTRGLIGYDPGQNQPPNNFAPLSNLNSLLNSGSDIRFPRSAPQTCPGPHRLTHGGPNNSQMLVAPQINVIESETRHGPIRRWLRRRTIVRVRVLH